MHRPLLDRESKWEDWDLATSSSSQHGSQESEDEDVEIWNFERWEYTKLLGNGEKASYGDLEQNTEKKIKYPKSVFFIVGNEFCERFSYYGMKAILILYLHFQLFFSEDDSTVIYHVWAMLCYFTPILGAIIADASLGRYKTIFYISIIYVLGNIFLSVSAVSPIFTNLDLKKALAFIGLLLIALGTGGIKPCVSAFGGDQFVLPQQEKQLVQFFFIFYFSINSGSLLSTFITPILRDDVKCFGDDCYTLAFGVPAVLMFVALVILVIGNVARMYKIVPPQGTILKEVFGCISEALGKKRHATEKKEHWLDYAKDKYGSQLVADVKVLLKVLFLYIPLPFFWALFDQQGSRWTFQATRMDGQVGSWIIKPDQMQVVNPLLILVLIPIFDRGVYPLLARCNILKRQLPRMFTGGVLAGVAFLISGFLEIKLEETYPVKVGPGMTRMNIINSLPCNVTIIPSWQEENFTMSSFEQKIYDASINNATEEFQMELHFTMNNCGAVDFKHDNYSFTVKEKTAHAVMITADTSFALVENNFPPDEIQKANSGMPKLRMLYNVEMMGDNVTVRLDGHKDYEFYIIMDQGFISGTEFQEVEPDSYHVYMPDDECIGNFTVKLGGVYDFLVQKDLSGKNTSASDTVYEDVKLYEVTPPNSVHMLWLIPQYFILTASEIMFSITGLEFSFTQAPATMKSVLQAAWLLTVSFGNLIVVIIAEAKFFERQSMEFFLFAVLMFVDMIIFAFMAMRYKYVDQIAAENSEYISFEEKGKVNEGFSKEDTKF